MTIAPSSIRLHFPLAFFHQSSCSAVPLSLSLLGAPAKRYASLTLHNRLVFSLGNNVPLIACSRTNSLGGGKGSFLQVAEENQVTLFCSPRGRQQVLLAGDKEKCIPRWQNTKGRDHSCTLQRYLFAIIFYYLPTYVLQTMLPLIEDS